METAKREIRHQVLLCGPEGSSLGPRTCQAVLLASHSLVGGNSGFILKGPRRLEGWRALHQAGAVGASHGPEVMQYPRGAQLGVSAEEPAGWGPGASCKSEARRTWHMLQKNLVFL